MILFNQTHQQLLISKPKTKTTLWSINFNTQMWKSTNPVFFLICWWRDKQKKTKVMAPSSLSIIWQKPKTTSPILCWFTINLKLSITRADNSTTWKLKNLWRLTCHKILDKSQSSKNPYSRPTSAAPWRPRKTLSTKKKPIDKNPSRLEPSNRKPSNLALIPLVSIRSTNNTWLLERNKPDLEVEYTHANITMIDYKKLAQDKYPNT